MKPRIVFAFLATLLFLYYLGAAVYAFNQNLFWALVWLIVAAVCVP